MNMSQPSLKPLVITIRQLVWASALAAPLACVSQFASATDLDVYTKDGAQPPAEGGPVVTMMFDTSSSMGLTGFSGEVGDRDYDDLTCTASNYGQITPTPSVTIAGETITYDVYGCTVGSTPYYDRLSRLKLALIPLLANKSDSGIKNNIKIALGQFSSEIIEGVPDNKTGSILVPARPLDDAQRIALIRAISSLKANGITPTGSALAEAGAYMLGTNTSRNVVEKKIGIELGARGVKRFGNKLHYKYYVCPELASRRSVTDEVYSAGQQQKLLDIGLTDILYCKFNSYFTNPPITASTSDVSITTAQLAAGVDFDRPEDFGITNFTPNSMVHNFPKNNVSLYFHLLSGYYPEEIASGFGYSVEASKQGHANYISPLSSRTNTEEQCSIGEDGIFLLTDGFPTASLTQNAVSTTQSDSEELYGREANKVIKKLMDTSLNGISSQEVDCTIDDLINKYKDNGPSYGFEGAGTWNYPSTGCIGSYAKILRETKGIKTAIVGLGKLFSDIPKTRIINSDGVEEEVYNCDGLAAGETAEGAKRSICKVAEKGQGYGEGGFYYAQTSDDIAKSLIDFVGSVSSLPYQPQPGEGPSVSANLTDSTKTSDFAYLPLMQPLPGKSNLLWPGNLKKYRVKNGSLFDQDDKHIFSNIGGQLRDDVKGYWSSTTDSADGSQITQGGVSAKLNAPASTTPNNIRNVFVESKSNTGAENLTSIKIENNRPNFGTADAYDRQRKHYLLNFLGYDVPVFNADNTAITNAPTPNPLEDISSFVPTNNIKILSGVHNNNPQEILYEYKQTYNNDTGETTETQVKRVLYGSMDGALHLVTDGSDAGQGGKEVFAFIPNVIVKSDQVAAFKEDSTQLPDGSINPAGKVAFGVDAPWYVRTKYRRNYAEDGLSVTITTTPSSATANDAYVKAYGGLGRGGVGFYALDITDMAISSANHGADDTMLGENKPSILFKKTPSSTGFSRLGHTWSQPQPARVNISTTTGTGINATTTYTPTDVLFLSGGYDLCYDIPEFTVGSSDAALITKIKADTTLAAHCLNAAKTSTITEAKGNAIYMIDANDGTLLWSTSATSGSTPNANIVHSIPAEVSVIDMDLDGFVDSIYFADLGGQLFRADFDKNKGANESSWAKVERILNTTRAGKNIPLRFYERPVISSYRLAASGTGSTETVSTVEEGGTKTVLVASIASGDRNSPITKLTERQYNNNPNKLITVWNADKIRIDTDGDGTADGSAVTINDMLKLDWNPTNGSGNDMSDAHKLALYNGTKKGWYDDLTYFNRDNSEDTKIAAENAAAAADAVLKKARILPTTGNDSDIKGNNISYLRSMGQPVMRAGRLFINVFNQLAYVRSELSCTPVPTGVTAAHEYCLPFGKCANGRGSTTILGAGIANATFGTTGNSSRDTTLISIEQNAVPPTDSGDSEGGSNGAGGSDTGTGNAVGSDSDSELVKNPNVFHSLYKLLPRAWFERFPTPTSNSASPSDGSSEGSD